MESSSDCSSSNGFSRVNQFALVSYIPDPLGSFLDALRLHLVPECKPHAHVTILPPRPLCPGLSGNVDEQSEQAIQEIRQIARRFRPFTVRLGNVSKFPVSDVIHLEIESGKRELEAVYRAMNCGSSSFCEPFPYSPHITLGQNLPKENVDSILEAATAAWNGCSHERSFEVRHLSFVQNTTLCRWLDLADVTLGARRSLADGVSQVTQTIQAEPLHQA